MSHLSIFCTTSGTPHNTNGGFISQQICFLRFPEVGSAASRGASPSFVSASAQSSPSEVSQATSTTAVGGARRGMSPSRMLDDASTPSATSPPRRLLANTGSCRAQNPEPNPFLKSPTEKKLASAPKVMHHHGARHLLPDALFQPVLMPVQTVARSSDVHRTAGLAPLPRIPSPRQPGPPHGYPGVSVDPRVRSDILGEGSSISPRSASMSSRAAPVHRPRSPELVHAPAARTNGVPAPLADQTSAHRTVPSVDALRISNASEACLWRWRERDEARSEA